ncbi:MAG: hypothetical protein LLG00_08410, partial [Planctomycetaceae bacterium]|nr:hypothetical protein [Planctomycetaceae bacterium]
MRKHCKSSCRPSRWESIMNLLGFRSKQCNCGGRKKRSYSFEPLEERQLLSVCHWTGGGGDSWWTTVENWAESQAPGPNDDVYFDSRGTPAITNNNIAGLALHSVTITEPGYELAGCAISVTDSVLVNVGSGTSTISLDVATTSATTVSVGDNSRLWQFGLLQSTSGDPVKAGAGTLLLTNPNSVSPAVQAGAVIKGDASLASYVSVAGAASVNEGSQYTLQLSSTATLRTSP